MRREAMAIPRVSRLHKHILRVLLAEHHRTHGRTSMEHLELVKALGGDKSNISHSLRTLETRGWIVGLDHGVGHASSLKMRYKHLRTRGKKCSMSMTVLWGRSSLPYRLPTTHAAPPDRGQYSQ